MSYINIVHTVYGLSRNYYNKMIILIHIVCNIHISMYLLAIFSMIFFLNTVSIV